MGGKGAGHKSVRARMSRLENIQKARAARRRAPLPWRSGMESWVIEQLVWQWWVEGGGQRTVVGGQKRQQQVPRRLDKEHRDSLGMTNMEESRQWSKEKAKADSSVAAKKAAPRKDILYREQVVGSPQIIARVQSRPWSRVRVARLLGVSHTWVNKLVKRIEADPDRMRRKMMAFAPASLERLERAREETRRERAMGRLRGPIRWRRVKVRIQGKEQRMVVVTAEERRRRVRNIVASGMTDETRQQQIPHTAGRRPIRNDRAFLPYGELPAWARGFVLPEQVAMVIGQASNAPMLRGVPQGRGNPATAGRPDTAGKPRMVRFAFRGRRR